MTSWRPSHFSFDRNDGTVGGEVIDIRGLPTHVPLSPIEASPVALPVPTRRRAAWRVTMAALILGSCRGKAASIEQLHCLMWAISSEQNMALFLSAWNSNDPRKKPLRRMTPDLADTLAIARAEGLVAEKGKARFVLLPKGEEYLRLIAADDDVLVQEKRFLAGLRPISATRMWERLGSVQPSMGAAVRGNT
jgi:hypothetical protein